MATSIERAWAAGFFEGEGCFYAHYYKPRHDGSRVMRVAASLCQKDQRLLRRFKGIAGFGIICNSKKNVAAWKTSRIGEAAKLFKLLRFQLGTRRQQRFAELLAQEQNQVFRPRKPKRTHCGIGHDLQKVGTRVDGTCAACDRVYKRAWYRQNGRRGPR